MPTEFSGKDEHWEDFKSGLLNKIQATDDSLALAMERIEGGVVPVWDSLTMSQQQSRSLRDSVLALPRQEREHGEAWALQPTTRWLGGVA